MCQFPISESPNQNISPWVTVVATPAPTLARAAVSISTLRLHHTGADQRLAAHIHSALKIVNIL